jgi:hypothetical protein
MNTRYDGDNVQSQQSSFQLPPVQTTDAGDTRRVGFELEFSGIGLEEASRAVAGSLGGELARETQAEHLVRVPDLGDFGIEIDWDFLKRMARESAAGPEKDWVEPLSQAAPLLVPVEVVAPPIPLDRLDRLTPMVDALRDAGAQGTEESLIAAYGVHINPEIPSLDAPTLHRYLRAFALLQWWLVDAHHVDPMRRLTPYVNPWPEAYLREVLALESPDNATLIDSYLRHNATRNRALDMLPLMSEIDEPRVQRAVEDPRVKSRPTFHYRLPNCHIEDPGWSLANSWNLWCAVEALADDSAALDQLTREFIDAERLIIGVARGDWVQRVGQWLSDRGLA